MEENRNNIKPKFLNLWPTQFMEMSLPGHETANPVIKNNSTTTPFDFVAITTVG